MRQFRVSPAAAPQEAVRDRVWSWSKVASGRVRSVQVRFRVRFSIHKSSTLCRSPVPLRPVCLSGLGRCLVNPCAGSVPRHRTQREPAQGQASPSKFRTNPTGAQVASTRIPTWAFAGKKIPDPTEEVFGLRRSAPQGPTSGGRVPERNLHEVRNGGSRLGSSQVLPRDNSRLGSSVSDKSVQSFGRPICLSI